MASGWQSKAARLLRMDWEEWRVRLEQEFHKRGDLLAHRLGVRQKRPAIADLASSRGQFFFPANEIQERVELLRKHLAEEVSEVLHEADEICLHRFRLLGYENLDYGVQFYGNSKVIDWHLDAVHSKRAPLDPWFAIPFLDFARVGDHKITWELNRHQHMVTLAKARLLSGDDKYTRELFSQWHSWIRGNPYPLGINWGSSLEVAFRSLSWIWVDQFLSHVPEYSSFRSQLLPELAFHGLYIERYLSTYFSPNTHLLGEAVALFFLGTLYPQMPRAAGWKESGWKIVLREAERQVRPDGVYFEQSLYYHVYALDFFLHARLLAVRNGIVVPPSYDEIVGRMLEVVAALAQSGPAEGFGDDDGGRLWNSGRNRTEYMTDPLALGAVMYSKKFSAARLTEESIWLLGNSAVNELSQEPTRVEAESKAFRDGGLYILADSQPFAQEMVVDAGPQGVGRSGHGHADALSLRLTMDGTRWLVDAGSGVYISGDPAERNAFRGTAAHNTMLVDGLDQAVADEPFSWRCIPQVKAEKWIVGKTFSCFVGSHSGYERLADPVTHRRHVLKVAGGVWLVRDIALGAAEHELEVRWHLAPTLKVEVLSSNRMEISGDPAPSVQAALSLMVPEETAWKLALGKTHLSPSYGVTENAPVVSCRGRMILPAEIATVLIPSRASIVHESESFTAIRLLSSSQAGVQAYRLDCAHHSQQFLFASGKGKETWKYGPWTSDAETLYSHFENGRLSQLILIGGTFANWQGHSLLSAFHPAEFFEWRGKAGRKPQDGGGFSVTSLFDELTSEELSSDESGRSPHCSSTDKSNHGSTLAMDGVPPKYAEKR